MSKWNIVSGVSCCDSASEYEPSERYVREGVKYLTFTSDMIKKKIGQRYQKEGRGG